MLDFVLTSPLLPTAPLQKTTSSSTLRYISISILNINHLSPKAAALEAEVWPQAGGPQGSLGESLKRWTHQPGIPLVNARLKMGKLGFWI